jgi:hypothetical protein
MEIERGVSSWVTTPTGRRPSKERRHRHGAADHKAALIGKPDVGAVGSVRARADPAVHPGLVSQNHFGRRGSIRAAFGPFGSPVSRVRKYDW